MDEVPPSGREPTLDERIGALAQHLDDDSVEIWSEYGFVLGSDAGDYFVATWKESYRYAIETLMDSYDEIYDEELRSMAKYMKWFDKENWARFFDKEKWARYVIETDGLAHVLAHYDGEMNKETFNGIEFYIFKQN